MRRFWAYVGAVLPLAAMTGNARGAVNASDTSFSGNSDFPDETDAAGKGAAGAGNGQVDEASPVKTGNVQTGSSGESHSDNSVAEEISGLLNELDSMNAPAAVNNPAQMVAAASAMPDMYAPAHSAASGGSVGGSSSVAAVPVVEEDTTTETEAETEETEAETEDNGSSMVEDPIEPDVNEPDVEDVDSMMVMLGGAAGGPGDTTNFGHIDLDVVDYGHVTVAYGMAAFSATSDWDGTGTPPAAYAETFLDVYDADLVFFYRQDDGSVSDDGTQYTESSVLYVVAIDFEDDHSLANEFDMTDDNGFEHEFDPGLMLAAHDGTPAEGYFGHEMLDGIPFEAFSQFFNSYSGEVNIEDTGSTVEFYSNTYGESDDTTVVLVGDATAIEDVGSSADLVAVTDLNTLSASVSGVGADTFTSIDGQMFDVGDEFSGITGLAIGIA